MTTVPVAKYSDEDRALLVDVARRQAEKAIAAAVAAADQYIEISRLYGGPVELLEGVSDQLVAVLGRVAVTA